MGRKSIYRGIYLKSHSDVEKLISLIKENGNFKISDYNRVMRNSINSNQAMRIKRKLIAHVLPLVTTTQPIGKKVKASSVEQRPVEDIMKNKRKNKQPKNSIWDNTYKAKDFRIEDGRIVLENYELKSVRIEKVHPNCLKDIEHEFRIAPVYSSNGTVIPFSFHFEPYTDLSFLLNEIKKQVEIQERQKEIDQVYKDWEKNLNKYLHKNALNKYGQTSCVMKLSDFDVYVKDDKTPKVLLWNLLSSCKPNLCVPKDDVLVEDGKVTINTQNVSLVKQDFVKYREVDEFGFKRKTREIIKEDEPGYVITPSWKGFFIELSELYDKKVLRSIYKELKEKYIEDINKTLNKIVSRGTIEMRTYLSKKGFNQKYRGKSEVYLYLDLNGKLYLPIFTHYLYSPYKGVLNYDFTSDVYMYPPETLNEIATIIDKNWAFIERLKEWILIDEVPTENRNEDKTTDEMYLRKYLAGSSILYQVTEYYENRLELPKSCSCKSHNILFFDENANHLSDQGLGDSFKSFIVWSKEKDASIIRLQPTDEKYTNYTFLVDTKVCSLEAASYIIWRHFACRMYNKRQGFQPDGIFRLFGIYSVVKGRYT